MIRHNFRKLDVWWKARNLIKEIYVITQKLPENEKYGLTSQIRRAAISIPSNIAEGCGRGTDNQLANFFKIAHGSACELETQLLLSGDLEFISELKVNELINNIHEIQKMILSLIATLKSKV